MYSLFSLQACNRSYHTAAMLSLAGLKTFVFVQGNSFPNTSTRDSGYEINRPFPSSSLPPLQSESKCEGFVMVISSTLHKNDY